MATSVDYDYDAVINRCSGQILQDVSTFATDLNSLGNELVICEEAFHSSESTGAIPEIYNGFAACIGTTSSNTGLAGLNSEIARIINVTYSEAMTDKSILEGNNTGGASVSGSSVQEPSAEAAPATSPMAQTTETVEAPTTMAAPEPQNVQTMTQDAQPTPPPSSGQVQGTLSPGTMANTFQAQAYNLPPDEYKAYCATIYAEAAEGNSYMESDTMGVASAILNRVENGGWGGNTVTDVISASGQFSGYGFQNQKFAAAMNDPSIIPQEMRAAIDRTLAGERNTTGQSFSGNGTHNSFR